MQIGYKLFAEAYSPQEIVRQAVRAEEAGFVLGVGSGERLNEHVVGAAWPSVSVSVRHEMFRESLEIIRLLWSGGYQSYSGKHLTTSDARVFDLPDSLPLIAVAAGGPRAARIAAELGDGLVATEPNPELIGAYRDAGGTGPAYAEAPLAWATDEASAVASAHRLFRFGPTGWKVQSELPNVAHFEAARSWITEDDMRSAFDCGPDVARHLEIARPFVGAGFDRLALVNAGPDPDGFLDFFASELAGPVRELMPS